MNIRYLYLVPLALLTMGVSSEDISIKREKRYSLTYVELTSHSNNAIIKNITSNKCSFQGVRFPQELQNGETISGMLNCDPDYITVFAKIDGIDVKFNYHEGNMPHPNLP